MNTLTMGNAPQTNAALSVDETNDLRKYLAKMHQGMAHNGSGPGALQAMRAMWEWICRVLDRIARVFSLQRASREPLTDDQLTGKAATPVDLVPQDGTATIAEVPANAVPAEQTVLSEIKKVLEYLAETPIDPSLLNDPETAEEFVRLHAERLGSYRSVFSDEAQKLDVEINAKCALIAEVAGTTAPVIRAQIGSDFAGAVALYDKDGTIKPLLEQRAELAKGMGRVELAAIGLLEASSHVTAAPGLHGSALSRFSEVMPGKYLEIFQTGDMASQTESLRTKDPSGTDVDSASPPPTEIAAASSESSVGEQVKASDLSLDTPANDVPEKQQEKSFLARAGTSAKETLQSPATAVAVAGALLSPQATGLKLVSSVVLPVISDAIKNEAMSSSFVKSGFAKLEQLSQSRRAKSGADWGDLPTERQQ